MIKTSGQSSCSLQTHNGVVDYYLKRSKRKSVMISIDRKGEVHLSAPNFISHKAIEDFICEKSKWIIKNTRVIKNQRKLFDQYKLENGGVGLFLGKSYEIRMYAYDGKKVKIDFESARWNVFTPEGLSDDLAKKQIKKGMTSWYRLQALEILGSRVFHYCRIMGLEPLKIAVRTQKSIWGSCHPSSKSVFLNWKIIMAPMEVVDYVIVHELSHLKVPSHSKRFWAQVQKIMPDYKIREKWLKDNSLRMGWE